MLTILWGRCAVRYFQPNYYTSIEKQKQAWQDLLNLKSRVKEQFLTSQKVMIYLLEPLQKDLRYHFYLCQGYGRRYGHQGEAIQPSTRLLSYVADWIWILVVDHDEHEQFGHYQSAWNKIFWHAGSAEHLKDLVVPAE